jgi:uncharacterized membrane protein YoaK (UPF0700 family)
MPVQYARFLIGRQRSTAANRQLGLVLAFVAGAINAGGFLAVLQYTSHVTGMVSTVADQLVIGRMDLVLDSLVGVLSFLCGAMTCAVLINYARRKDLSSEYALPFLLEAVLILCFGFLGARMTGVETLLVPFTVILLCFIMGLQNAIVTKLSNAVIRTTHMTGIVTDLGIELGKLVYWNRKQDTDGQVCADRERLAVLSSLLACFLIGGVTGAFGFKLTGYVFTIPMALILAFMALVPTLDDLQRP